MSKHTPGPWKPIGVRGDVGIHGTLPDGSDTAAIAFVRHQGDSDANIRLIAAAPSLLEALQDIIASAHKSGIELIDLSRGRAAIALATETAVTA